MALIKRYEYWNPDVFNFPYFVYLFSKCAINGISIKTLVKANYDLEYGNLRTPKMDVQKTIGEKYFPKTIFLSSKLSKKEKVKKMKEAVKKFGYPIIAKPSLGECGKAIKFIRNEKDIDFVSSRINADYLIQEYIDYPLEFGVFYVRLKEESKIIAINQKHFPKVVGDGKRSIKEIVSQYENFSHHWNNFLSDFDTSKVLKKGEELRLSHIGSHTMGCVFTEDTHLVTKELEKAMFNILDKVPGYNFGRVDLRAKSVKNLQKGKFVFIEANGVASLPTNMFDPNYSVWQAYKVFFNAGNYLVKVAKENKNAKMHKIELRKLLKQLKEDKKQYEETHLRLMED